METIEQRVPVVTAFVYQGDKIALIKRSQEVGTYKGKWAAFSGYVERLPINQAWLELFEEAGVTENQVELQGIGLPTPVDDPVEGRQWLVFPYLFRLHEGVEIKTNWEAAELAWFLPGEIANLDTVPGLQTAFKCVWPAFGDQEFWEGLAHVATNTDDGATELARRGLEVLGGYVQANYQKIDRATLLRAIRAFAASRPSMGVFPDLGARLMLAIEREDGRAAFDDLVEELLDMVDDTTDLCINEAAKGLKGMNKIFTLSHSEAVADTILTWHSNESEVIIAESGPRFEGRALAEYLQEQGVGVRTVPDSELDCAAKMVDAVLVGCDAITPDKDILNKVGTRAAVEAAHDAGIPVYAVAQTFKIMPPGWPVFIERQAPSDYDENSDEYVGPPVFDLTPFSRFDAVFTEEGPLTIERLEEIQRELGSVELIPGA